MRHTLIILDLQAGCNKLCPIESIYQSRINILIKKGIVFLNQFRIEGVGRKYEIYKGDKIGMKIGTIFVLVLGISLILAGCYLTKKPTDPIKITENDKKVILEYLDTKTNDIARPSRGKMYSAFKLLGTDQDKVYIWLVKLEYFKVGNKITHEDGDAVGTPVVLYIKKNDKGISITKHKYPEEGEYWGKSVKRLFPPNIRFPDYNDKVNLEKITKSRAEENLKLRL